MLDFDWEKLYLKDTSNAVDVADRVKVPGGWIVRSIVLISSQLSMQMIFISDPEYKWTIQVEG